MVKWETLDALSRELELCDVTTGSAVVAILPARQPELADLLRAALARTRADVIDVRPLDSTDPTSAPIAGQLGELIARADLVLDATVEPSVLSAVEGVRVLRVLPLASEAYRFPPHAALGRRVAMMLDGVHHGSALHLTDRHGTDLQIGIEDGLYAGDAGRPGEGTIATYPSGWLELVPGPNRVDGDLIIMPGDGNLTLGVHFRSPVRLKVRNDRIVAIDGDNSDSDVLRALFEQLETPDAYGFGALVVGANPSVATSRKGFDPILVDGVVSRFTAGVVRLAFGDNEHADRPCPGLVEFALAERSLSIDGSRLVQSGELVGDLAPDVYERHAT